MKDYFFKMTMTRYMIHLAPIAFVLGVLIAKHELYNLLAFMILGIGFVDALYMLYLKSKDTD